jgi:hypothetical protein
MASLKDEEHSMHKFSSLSMQDLIALGEYSRAINFSNNGDATISSSLSSSKSTSNKSTEINNNSDDGHDQHMGVDEILRRLPLFLRLLAPSRSLSSIPHISFISDSESTQKDECIDESQDTLTSQQDFIDDIVASLETIAATYAQAENLEVFVSTFVPRVVTKIMGKSSTRKNNNNNAKKNQQVRRSCLIHQSQDISQKQNMNCDHTFMSTKWETSILTSILDKLSTKKDAAQVKIANHAIEGDDDVINDDDDDDNQEFELKKKLQSIENEYSKTADKSMKMAENILSPSKSEISCIDVIKDEESPEFIITKILIELLGLINSSLKSIHLSMTDSTHHEGTSQNDPKTSSNAANDGEDDNIPKSTIANSNTIHYKNKNPVLLQINPDSILFNETHTSSFQNDHSDLSAIFVSLLHHVPILRHDHIANALCRACTKTGLHIPQCAHIIQHLAANAPATSCLLLRGCIDAYHYANTLLLSSQSKRYSSEHQQQQKQQSNTDIDDRFNYDLVQGATCIIRSAKESIVAIAKISQREASHVITTLKQSHAMPDVFLTIAMEIDHRVALALLVECFISQHVEASKRSLSDNHASKLRKTRLNRKRKRQCISSFVKNTSGRKQWIVDCLKKNSTLASKVRQYVLSRLESIIDKKGEGRRSWGEAMMMMQIQAGLIYSIGIGSGSSVGSGSTYLTSIMNAISAFSKMCQEEKNVFSDTVHPNSNDPADECIKMTIASCVILCTKFPPIADGRDSFIKTPSLIACTECFKCQLDWNVSASSQSYLDNVLSCVQSSRAPSLQRMIIRTVFQTSTVSEHGNNSEYMNFCQWAYEIIQEKNLKHHRISSITTFNVYTIIQNMEFNQNQYNDFIKNFLNNAEKCEELFEDENTFELVKAASKSMKRCDPPIIPIILPLSMEALLFGFLKKYYTGEWERKFYCQVILQLVYVFTFLDTIPNSPFAINLRSLPIRAIIEISSVERNEGNRTLQRYIMKHNPESFSGCVDNIPLSIFSSLGTPKLSKNVGVSIRNRLKRSNPNDPPHIERLFVYARAKESPSDVDTEASIALLESLDDSYNALTYNKLCQDPLLLMKCSLKVWTDESLRRITLAIMQRLLEANENIIQESSITSEAAEEFLVSRDLILLRSWLLLLSREKIENMQVTIECQLLISMVRSTVSNRKGIFAAFVRQLAPATMVDWMVYHVPEIRSEVTILMQILEYGTLSAIERIYLADAGLKIAITYGSKCEEEFRPLAFTALSICVNSFYFAIGPIGVPVNVICDQGGKDTTQICRAYLFRILTTVQTMKGDLPQIKNEARMVLSKLASLCKSDMNFTGLTGIAAQRRKLILKELWDALVKVNNSIGGGIQLNSY